MLLAGSMITVAPLVVLFVLLQRYFIERISLSGLGGRKRLWAAAEPCSDVVTST